MARTARSAALVASCLLLLALAVPGARADDQQLIEDLRECLDRTDVARGQDAEWREAHCPYSPEAAKQKLEELLDEQAEAVAEEVEKAKKKSAPAASSSDTDDAVLDQASTGGSATKGASKKKTAATPATLPGVLPALPLLPSLTQQRETDVLAEPCSVIEPQPLLTAIPSAVPGFGFAAPVTSVIGSGFDQVRVACRDILGSSVPSPAPFTLQAQGELTDVTIAKTAQDSPPAADILQTESGLFFQYTIEVTNVNLATADPAENVVMTDDFPDEFDYLGATTTQGTCEQTLDSMFEFQCNLGTVAVGATVTIIALAHVPDNYCTLNSSPLPAAKNEATVVASNETVAAPETNYSAHEMDVLCSSVKINTSATDTTPLPGDTFNYLISVADAALVAEPIGRATGVVVVDDLPPGLQALSAASSQGSCGIGAGSVVTCNLGAIEVDNGAVIVITTKVLTAAGCQLLQNTGVISALNEYTDAPHQDDNSSTETIEVECSPNIVITKTAEVDERDVTYTLTATNNGTANAQGVVVNDDLDDRFQGVTASASQGTCSVGSGNTVGCELGEIVAAQGTAVTVTIHGTLPVDGCTTVVNSATGAAENEPTGERGDNSASVSISAGGDCVFGLNASRGEVVAVLAATGVELVPLLAFGLLLLLAGAAALRLGRERTQA